VVLASGCASGEMGRAAGDGGDGPISAGDDDDASSSDPSGTPSDASSDDAADDATDSDPSVGASSDSDPSDSDPSDSDPSDSDPSDSDPSGDSSTGTVDTTDDPTDATTTDPSDSDPSDSDPSTTTDDSATDTDPSATDTDPTDTAADDPVDLSGYIVVQTDSQREFEIPDGTLVPRGGYVIIARNAAPGAFQNFWGVNWGDEVVYFDTQDSFPTINGAETFTLVAPGGAAVDGPTPMLEIATGVTRIDPAMSADLPAAWSVSNAPNQSSTPGAGGPDGGTSGAPFISEYVDPTGNGNFAYEFVELRVAP
jgi:hypothetical protein